MRARVWSGVSDAAIALVGIGLALAVRLTLLDFKSVDYFNYTKVWYNTLRDGGFSAFSQSFSNYNLPYLYLLYLIARFLPDVPGLVATKLPSIAADFVIAYFAFRIVRTKHEAKTPPFLAALGCLFAPTVILNSAFWGQADSLYTAALIASLYFILTRNGLPAMLSFGIAIAFKAQALILGPLLLALLLRREIPWKHALLVPLVMLVALIPALVAGRPILDLLLIYPSQAAQYEQLSMHAPSALALIPSSGQFYPYFYPVGLVLGITVAIVISLGAYWSPVKLSPALLLELALLCAMWLPFLLPKMHERYFYPADVLSILLPFFVPQLFFVPVAMITVSFFAYQPTLFGVEPIPMGMLALVVFVLVTTVTRHAYPLLFPASAAK
jgi:Gpi18-like mannosyltransferase